MILKCPNCTGAITYDPASADLMCPFCGSIFLTKDFPIPEEASPSKADSLASQETSLPQKETAATQEDTFYTNDKKDTDDDTMECKVYHCTACAAELIINDVESSTFCAYCGQPTIVFDRITRQRKPDYIIPFSITKQEALSIIQTQLKKGSYIPKKVKNFKIDILRGVYVPFWLFDIYHYDNMKLADCSKGKLSSSCCYYIREAEHTFHNITVNASRKFQDDYAIRLEPYETNKLQRFNPSYLSGFYADCSNEYMDAMRFTACERARTLFNQSVINSFFDTDIEITRSLPIQKVIKKSYALLPVWFVVFHYKKKSYTIMVNGQTGKMIGAVPIEKKKVAMHMLIVYGLFSSLSTYLYQYLITCQMPNKTIGSGILDFFRAYIYLYEEESFIVLFFFILIPILFTALQFSFKDLLSYRKSRKLTSNMETKHYVSNRQGGKI